MKAEIYYSKSSLKFLKQNESKISRMEIDKKITGAIRKITNIDR